MEPKDPENVLEVIWLYKILPRRLRTKEKEDEQRVIKVTKVAAARPRPNVLVRITDLLNKVYESWIVFPFPKRSLYKRELQAAPPLRGLRQSGSTVQILPMPCSPLNRDLN